MYLGVVDREDREVHDGPGAGGKNMQVLVLKHPFRLVKRKRNLS